MSGLEKNIYFFLHRFLSSTRPVSLLLLLPFVASTSSLNFDSLHKRWLPIVLTMLLLHGSVLLTHIGNDKWRKRKE